MRFCSDELRGFYSGLLRRYDRIVIVGPSGCGKTTLAIEVKIDDRPVLHNDDFKHLPWDQVSEAIIKSAAMAGPRWVVEGVKGASALRKGLEADAVLYLDKPRRPQLRGQINQGTGIATIFKEWRDKNAAVPVYRLPEDA